MTDKLIGRLRFSCSEVTRLIASARMHALEQVLWVVDHGSYLTIETPVDPLVVYAEGFNPGIDADWEHRLIAAFSGETFEEFIAVADIEASIQEIMPDAETVILEIYPTEIEIVLAQSGRRRQRQGHRSRDTTAGDAQ